MIVFVCYCFFFFFKQKTAYEMRISDWSSDVCSSDLRHQAVVDPQQLWLVDLARPEAQFHRHLAERLVEVVHRRVRADQRDHGGDDQQDAAGCLQPAEICKKLRRIGTKGYNSHPHQPALIRTSSNATHAANAASRMPPSARLTRRSPRRIGNSINANRTEAHTSDLQSLMPISDSDLYLTKKTAY